ncbi:MAG: hypothetical protein QXG39_02590 [Candidatus Aenigmatarchaeota archaeon]
MARVISRCKICGMIETEGNYLLISPDGRYMCDDCWKIMKKIKGWE